MNDIQIIEVTVEDYRQYEGTESFDLRVTEDQNINVIQGQNGSGKSNFLNAITLCFYDKEPHLDDSEEQGLGTDPYVNSTRLNEIDVGETASGSIEVKLGRDEPKYIFERTFTTAKLGEDEYESETGELQLHQRFGNEWKPVDQPNTRLSEILPTRVYEYFFFDGEKLDTFFEEGYMAEVKEAILDVSHIQLLERAEDHLDTVQSEFERKSANFEGNTEKKEKSIETPRMSSKNSTRKKSGLNPILQAQKIEETRLIVNSLIVVTRKSEISRDVDKNLMTILSSLRKISLKHGQRREKLLLRQAS